MAPASAEASSLLTLLDLSGKVLGTSGAAQQLRCQAACLGLDECGEAFEAGMQEQANALGGRTKVLDRHGPTDERENPRRKAAGGPGPSARTRAAGEVDIAVAVAVVLPDD